MFYKFFKIFKVFDKYIFAECLLLRTEILATSLQYMTWENFILCILVYKILSVVHPPPRIKTLAPLLCVIAFVWKRKGIHCTFLVCYNELLYIISTDFSITLFGFLFSLAFNNRIENLTLMTKFRGPPIGGGGGPETMPLLPAGGAGPVYL